MRSRAGLFCLALSAAVATLTATTSGAPAIPQVTIVETPEGGIQPQLVAGARGTLHLAYFQGDPAGGDIYYVRLVPRDGRLTPAAPPVRVNTIAGSALAAGTVRGAQLALGRNGIVHVAWHGSKPSAANDNLTVPVWYARSLDGARFDEQRAVSGDTKGIDGSTIAADRSGRVVVGWHALGSAPGEGGRHVYLASSTNDGAAFAMPAPATTAPVGACGCCGLKAMFDRAGTLNLLYRAATENKHRDTVWVGIRNGVAGAPVRVHPWEIEACPMSTYALADAGKDVAAAWETAQQIYSATIAPATGSVSGLSAAPGSGSRKHPSIAVNEAGDRLLVWAEGTAWKRGGTFAWRLTNRNGDELASAPNAGVVPVWGLVAAAALPDGSFVVVR